MAANSNTGAIERQAMDWMSRGRVTSGGREHTLTQSAEEEW